jgi:hypothetical protein
MAEFFKNFTQKVTEVASTVKTKAKDVYDITALKVNLKGKEANLDSCFERLGRAYFVSINNGGNQDKLEALVNKAKSISQEILELKQKIAEAQNKRICEHCFSLIDNDALYCDGCGQKIVANQSTAKSNDDVELQQECEEISEDI